MHPTQRGASGGVLDSRGGMRRQARSRRAVSRVLRRSDPDAKRRVTRLGRRPRPSRLNAGAARKRLRRRDEQSAAPKRGARDQGVARGARRTPSFGGPALLPSLLRATRRTRGEPIAPALPLEKPRASLDDAPPCLGPLRPRERRRTPSRHQWTGFTHPCRPPAPPSPRSRSEWRGGPTQRAPRAGWGALPRGASSTIRRGCRWLPWPNRRVVLLGISPRPATPHPYPSPPLGFAGRVEGGARS